MDIPGTLHGIVKCLLLYLKQHGCCNLFHGFGSLDNHEEMCGISVYYTLTVIDSVF